MSSKKQPKKIIETSDSESDHDSDVEDVKENDKDIIPDTGDDGDDDEEEDATFEEVEEVEETEVNDEELKDGDVDAEAENCYFQYDTIIEEYTELLPPTQVLDQDRITLPKLTKYELVRVLGIRAQQISVGAKTLVKNIEGKSPVEIAIYELKNKMTPFKIRRPMPNNTYEIWKIKELDIDLPDYEEKGIISSFN